MNIEDILAQIGGRSREEMLAAKLRGENAMRDANSRAHELDLLAFAASGANNPNLAKATAALAGNRNAQFKPVAMGQTGFAIPGTGDFVENPAFAEEKQMQRVSQLQGTLASVAQRRDAASEANVLKTTLGLLGNQSRQQQLDINRMLAEAKLAEMSQKTEKQKEAKIVQLSGTLEKAGVPELLSALNQAEGRLSAHKEGDLPGYGRFEGSVPNYISTQDMQLSRQDLQSAANIMLKARSGSAVTDSESRRFLMELGSGAGMTEKAIREGFRKLRTHVDARVSNILAGVGDDVLSAYNERTGTPISRPAARKDSGQIRKVPNDGFGELVVK